jgi:hypothetical protein
MPHSAEALEGEENELLLFLVLTFW